MSQTDDLARVEYRHVPASAYDKGLESPLEALAVGWLGDRVPTTGAVDGDLLAALEHFSRHHYVDRGELGLHTCEICHRFAGGGELLIETAGRRYVLPQLVLHYIADHGYRPPEDFLRDLSEHWRSPDASRCRSDSCGSPRRLPCIEPCSEQPASDSDREELILLATRLRDQGLGAEGIKARLLQWARERSDDSDESRNGEATPPALEPAPGKRRHLAVYDYGMGGIWLLFDARSTREVEQRYPELVVYETRPDWMSPAEEQQYRAECLAKGLCWDIDATPSGWLKTLVDSRDAQGRDASAAALAASAITRVLYRALPIALLAGAACCIYWLAG